MIFYACAIECKEKYLQTIQTELKYALQLIAF
jgi:hypothetical protein